jgi:hypothetical protein
MNGQTNELIIPVRNAGKIIGIRTMKLKLFDYFCQNVLTYFH